MRLRHHLFGASFAAMRATGIHKIARRWTRGVGVILTLHHVRPAEPRPFAPNRLLEVTPSFLDGAIEVIRRAGYEFVSMDDALARIAAPDAQTRAFAAFTFDDGYRDNADHAAPVLRKHGVPWTLHVTTDFADGRGRLWWLEIEEAVRRLDRIELGKEDGETLCLPARTPREKLLAFREVYWHLRRGNDEQRLLDGSAALARAAGFTPCDLTRGLCLDWDGLRALLAAEPLIEIGAHTVSHPMLAKHGAEEARRQLLASKARIEAEIGRPVRHMAYPVGDPTSAGPRDFALAAEAGYASAVTTRPGHVFAEHGGHLHALPRISLNGLFQTEGALKAMLDGLPFALWNRGRRLNVG